MFFIQRLPEQCDVITTSVPFPIEQYGHDIPPTLIVRRPLLSLWVVLLVVVVAGPAAGWWTTASSIRRRRRGRRLV